MNQDLGFQFYRNILTNISILKLRKLHELKRLSNGENPLQSWISNPRLPAPNLLSVIVVLLL